MIIVSVLSLEKLQVLTEDLTDSCEHLKWIVEIYSLAVKNGLVHSGQL